MKKLNVRAITATALMGAVGFVLMKKGATCGPQKGEIE